MRCFQLLTVVRDCVAIFTPWIIINVLKLQQSNHSGRIESKVQKAKMLRRDLEASCNTSTQGCQTSMRGNKPCKERNPIDATSEQSCRMPTRRNQNDLSASVCIFSLPLSLCLSHALLFVLPLHVIVSAFAFAFAPVRNVKMQTCLNTKSKDETNTKLGMVIHYNLNCCQNEKGTHI